MNCSTFCRAKCGFGKTTWLPVECSNLGTCEKAGANSTELVYKSFFVIILVEHQDGRGSYIVTPIGVCMEHIRKPSEIFRESLINTLSSRSLASRILCCVQVYPSVPDGDWPVP